MGLYLEQFVNFIQPWHEHKNLKAKFKIVKNETKNRFLQSRWKGLKLVHSSDFSGSSFLRFFWGFSALGDTDAVLSADSSCFSSLVLSVEFVSCYNILYSFTPAARQCVRYLASKCIETSCFFISHLFARFLHTHTHTHKHTCIVCRILSAVGSAFP